MPFPPGMGSGAELTTEDFREQLRSSGSNPLSFTWFEILFFPVISCSFKKEPCYMAGRGGGAGGCILKNPYLHVNSVMCT